MQERPQFVQELLKRPLPPLHPVLGERTNHIYSQSTASQIVNALFHPLIETCLHIMNDDLFSAHFLARKMQQDDMGKWLHGILHLHEGDYANVKCWYRDMSLDLLRTFFPASGKSVDDCWHTSKVAEILEDVEPPPEHADQHQVRKAMWAELVCILEQLERSHGWERDVNGAEAYTQDQGDISEKKSGMLLGEGWRQF